MAHDVYPLERGMLPDGTVVFEERGKAADVDAALKAYDPRCWLLRNHTEGAWEIWRANEDGTQGRVGSWRHELLPHPMQVVADLAAHDTRRGYDPLAAHDALDAARERAEDAAAEEIALASADRLHYEWVDEISSHAPAARPLSLAPNASRRARAERS